ncbi:hypothetical protein Rhe02_73900 [Rhizocola hellebori]|uniref:DUF4132 domain-containing protein n=1 Tax=Rhizocola hellebori TaxID=1392758 RepID=A0A8J3QH47_9ACTN|nr:DUF4132 domain-containing protein [Rhizocola hellebori]GIH09323.1 hypothetical protein Rhe02_73900 [Rhizocola hellebori]
MRPNHWAELIPELTAEETARVEYGLAAALARIEPELQPTHSWQQDLDLADWKAVRSWKIEDLRRATLALHAWSGCQGSARLLRKLGALPLSWTRDDLVWALRKASEAPAETQAMAHLEIPAAIAARLDRELLTGLGPVLQALVDYVHEDYFVSADSRRWVSGMVGQALDMLNGSRVPGSVLHTGDTFGPRVRDELADMLTGSGVGGLLLHCATLDKPSPTAKWLKTTGQLVAAAPTGRAVAVAILELFAGHHHSLHDDTDRLLRGLMWTVAGETDDRTTELLAAVLRAAGSAPERAKGYPHAPRTAIATVTALSARPGELPIATFARMTLAVKNKALLSRLHEALAQAGALRGWSLGEAMELVVNDHGLDPEGSLRTTIGAYQAEVTVSADRARLTFERDGKPLKSAPAAIKDDTAALRALVKEIDKTLAQERQRVESVLSEERQWSYQDWVTRYLEHPITARLGRELLWVSLSDNTTGLPVRHGDGWALAPLEGPPVVVERVRLWHPALAHMDEVRAWRDHVVDHELRQPIKQIFREIYLLTPAEEQTRVYSNRFAGHILRYRQANALMRVRGWQSGYLGTWDGGFNGEARKEFGGGQWRASFYHDLVENADQSDYEARYCSTDQVRFERRDGAVWAPSTVGNVPPLIFTEAMRDVDLFVGVTSIAGDPQWTDRGENRFHDYWHQAGFGDLLPSAEVRRDALARLLPRTKIADRVSMTAKFVVVRGSLRTYKIHLGSGNILMEPNDAYLCIVAARDKGSKVHLPFAEDPMLSLILSKAFLLADDQKITDTTILQQLR